MVYEKRWWTTERWEAEDKEGGVDKCEAAQQLMASMRPTHVFGTRMAQKLADFLYFEI